MWWDQGYDIQDSLECNSFVIIWVSLIYFDLIWHWYDRMIAGIAAWSDILHETSGISLDGSLTKKDISTLISLGILHLFLPWWPDIAIIASPRFISAIHQCFKQNQLNKLLLNLLSVLAICCCKTVFPVLLQKTIIYPATNCPNVFFGFPFGEVFGREYSTSQRPSLGCAQTTLWQTHGGRGNRKCT